MIICILFKMNYKSAICWIEIHDMSNIFFLFFSSNSRLVSENNNLKLSVKNLKGCISNITEIYSTRTSIQNYKQEAVTFPKQITRVKAASQSKGIFMRSTLVQPEQKHEVFTMQMVQMDEDTKHCEEVAILEQGEAYKAIYIC